ncbi:MAG: hypothetical protein JWO32_1556 [Bacteroidetes bacterium]|nr:hypothetical protein [Bacteroidota bacterium]
MEKKKAKNIFYTSKAIALREQKLFQNSIDVLTKRKALLMEEIVHLDYTIGKFKQYKEITTEAITYYV